MQSRSVPMTDDVVVLRFQTFEETRGAFAKHFIRFVQALGIEERNNRIDHNQV